MIWLWYALVLLFGIGMFLAINFIVPLLLGKLALWWLPVWYISMNVLAKLADDIEKELRRENVYGH